MNLSKIIRELEKQNEEIWSVLRSIHEGNETSLEEIKEKLVFISGNIVAEVLIPLRDEENKDKE